MRIGYIKQTTKEQTEVQSELLIAQGCTKLYIEPANNIQYKSRVKLSEAMESITTDDILVVTRLSVLSHSVQHLLNVMKTLQDKAVILEAIEQQYSSNQTYSMDELLYYLKEFIEDLRKEKQAVGIYRAKEKGKRLGRPPKLTHNKIIKALELKKFNTSSQVANRLGVGRSTLLRHIAKHRSSNNVGKTKRAG